MKILVLEDEPDLLDLYEQSLSLAGHEVLRARHGLEGIALLDQRPELILVDLMMPVMDGYQFIRHLRRSPQKDTPAIVLSAVATGAWSKHVGANGYIPKPFDYDALIATIDRFRAA
ncbi:MAG: response regulator transcription factor [Chloroflexi bacterium]|nr:response regulator transcription factor [Chloroflexota bacterium]